MSRTPHKYLVRSLLVLGTVLAVLAIFAVWIERQALDPDEWASTSGKLLKNEQIQTALSQYLTDQLFHHVDVQAELAKRLPPQAKPLAGPIAGGLREFAADASKRAMASPSGSMRYARYTSRSRNLVVRSRNSSCTCPVGPLRCLATMISATPFLSESGLYFSSR